MVEIQKSSLKIDDFRLKPYKMCSIWCLLILIWSLNNVFNNFCILRWDSSIYIFLPSHIDGMFVRKCPWQPQHLVSSSLLCKRASRSGPAPPSTFRPRLWRDSAAACRKARYAARSAHTIVLKKMEKVTVFKSFLCISCKILRSAALRGGGLLCTCW